MLEIFSMRRFASSAISTATVLQPELEKRNSTPPFFTASTSSKRIPASPGMRSKTELRAAARWSIRASSRIGQTLANPPAR